METEEGSVDSAGVVVTAAFGVGGILAAVEEKSTSLGEAEISDSEVVEFSEGGVVEAAEVLAFTDVLMALFMGVVSSVAGEPGPVETEVTGLVVAVPGILVLAIIVAPEADVVARLVEAAAIVVVAAAGIVVVAEAGVTVVVASVVLVSKIVESAEEAVALVGAAVAVGVVAASVVASSPVSVVVSSPGVVAPEGWVVVSPRLVNTLGSAVEPEVPGVEVAACATVVLGAAATVSLVSEVVTIPLMVVSICRVEEAAAVVVIVPTGVGVEGPVGVVAVDVKSVSKVVESVAPVVIPSNEAVVAVTVVVSSTDSVVSLFTGVAVSVVVSMAVSVVVSSTGVMAELEAAVVAVPGMLVVIELVATVVLRSEAAVFVVAGARVVPTLADNEVASALVAPIPRFVEGAIAVAPTPVEGVAVTVVAFIAGDGAPVFADVVMAA